MSVREQLRQLVEAPPFQRFIIALIVFNAVTLGLETVPAVAEQHNELLHAVDRAVLAVFVVELLLRLFAHRLAFFREPWSIFDFVVVGISLLPHTGAFSVLRALRVLRVLRLISLIPSMRKVVEALLTALPGLGSIGALLALLLYVAAVMATKLFGAIDEEHFGDLWASLFTLFQVMTLEGWADIAREIMEEAPYAWAFFLVYILVSTFAVLNLFIAVVVNAMQQQVTSEMQRDEEAHAAEARSERAELLAEIRALREEVRRLRG